MSRYIDAEPYEQYLEEKIKLWRQREEEAHDLSMFEARRVHNALFYAKAQLKRIPTADVEEVRHGEWIRKRKFLYECSLCKRVVLIEGVNASCDIKSEREILLAMYPYCNCGAKMDGGIR